MVEQENGRKEKVEKNNHGTKQQTTPTDTDDGSPAVSFLLSTFCRCRPDTQPGQAHGPGASEQALAGSHRRTLQAAEPRRRNPVAPTSQMAPRRAYERPRQVRESSILTCRLVDCHLTPALSWGILRLELRGCIVCESGAGAARAAVRPLFHAPGPAECVRNHRLGAPVHLECLRLAAPGLGPGVVVMTCGAPTCDRSTQTASRGLWHDRDSRGEKRHGGREHDSRGRLCRQ